MSSNALNPRMLVLMAGIGLGMIGGGVFKGGGPVVTVIGVLLAGFGLYKIFRP